MVGVLINGDGTGLSARVERQLFRDVVSSSSVAVKDGVVKDGVGHINENGSNPFVSLVFNYERVEVKKTLD